MNIEQALNDLTALEARGDLNDHERTPNDSTRALVKALAEAAIGPRKMPGTSGPNYIQSASPYNRAPSPYIPDPLQIVTPAEPSDRRVSPNQGVVSRLGPDNGKRRVGDPA